MKPSFFILLLLLGSKFVSAQQMVWASFEKFSGTNTHCNVIGETDAGVLLLRFKDKNLKRNVYIDYYDHALRLKNSFGISERKKQVEKILLLNGKLYTIYQYPTYSAKQLFYKAHNYKNKESKSELKEWTSIQTDENKIYNFDINYNHSRTLGSIDYLAAISNEKSEYKVNFFDENLVLNTQTIFPIPSNAKDVTVTGRTIDQYGNFYLLYKTVNGSFFSRDNEIHHLASYNAKTKRWKDTELNTQEFFISSIIMKEDIVNKRILCSYFYSFDYKNGNFGLTNFAIDAHNQDEIYIQKQKLDSDFSRQITGSKLGKEKELNSFFIQDIIPTSDSGSIIVAERFFLTDQNETFYQNGIPVTTSRNVYNFEELLLFSANKYGGIKWNKVLLKKQNSINDGGYFSSVIIIPSKDKLNILYNEKLVYNGDVIQYSIDKEGNTTQKNLFRKDMAVYMIIPSESRVIGYNRAAIPMFLSNGERGLLKIVY